MNETLQPLQPVAMPTHGILVGITTTNSWRIPTAAGGVRCAYIATNSSQRLSFASIQSTKNSENVLRVATRPSYFPDMPYGLVVEVHLGEDLREGEAVYLSLAQAGATSYYPPQPIDDLSRKA